MHSSKPSKTRNTFGAITTTMAQVCGPSTIQRIVRAAMLCPPPPPPPPPLQQPMPTLLLLTPWTVTLTRNDNCARVKFILGSGRQSHATSSGCCSLMTWEMSITAFFLMSGLIFILIFDYINAGEPHPYVPKRCRSPRVSGLSPYSRPRTGACQP